MPNVRADQPRLLILETSGRTGRVAVALGSDLGPERTLEAARSHARDLAPAITGLCRERGWRVRDLNAILVSRGPGSYTGLRVGLITAKALAYATGAVLLALDTFSAIALQSPPEAAAIDVVADAQQRNLYVQRFCRQNSDWQAVTSLVIQSASVWLTGLERDVWVSGPGLPLVETDLPTNQPRVAHGEVEPMPASLLTLGLERWRAGEADEIHSVEPLYLRPSNAEVNWDKRVSGE